MACTHFKVWRMGRTGHVSCREAGVWYCERPTDMFGVLAVRNEICVENVLEAEWVWVLVDRFFGRGTANKAMDERLTVIKQHALEKKRENSCAIDDRDHAVYYKYELMLIPKLHALGYDAVYFKTFGYLWVLPSRRTSTARLEAFCGVSENSGGLDAENR